MTYEEANSRQCLNCPKTFPIIADKSKSNPHQKVFCCVSCRNSYRARRKNEGIKYIKKHHPDIYETAFACERS